MGPFLSPEEPVSIDHWRHLWDARRFATGESNNITPLDQLELHSQPLPCANYKVISAEEWPRGVEDFLHRAGELLRGNYVEDSDGTLIFHHSDRFLKWALLAPLHDPALFVGIVDQDNSEDELIGFLSATPIHLHHKELGYTLPQTAGKNETPNPKSAMIDFACVAAPYRKQRLCPFLYATITRKCQERGISHLICTSGDLVVYPCFQTRLNIVMNPEYLGKLVDIGFTRLRRGMTLEQAKDMLRLRSETFRPVSFRSMTAEDVPRLRPQFNKVMAEKYSIGLQFATDEEFAYTLLPQQGVVESLVVVPSEDAAEKGKTSCDFITFYFSEILVKKGVRRGETLVQAFAHYCIAEETPVEDLVMSAIVRLFAQEEEPRVDTVMCFDGLMGYTSEMQQLVGFGEGDGVLKYYQFNAPPCQYEKNQIAWFTT